MPQLSEAAIRSDVRGDDIHHGPERVPRAIDTTLHSSREKPAVMDLTREQIAFLADLRKGTLPATAAQDASVIGPLIRSLLVRWDDEPSEAGTRRKPRGTTFTLTELGEAYLAEHERQDAVGK